MARTKCSLPLLGAVGDFVVSFSAYDLAWLHARGWGRLAVSARKWERHQAESGLQGDDRHPYFLFLSFNQRFMAGCEELPLFLRPRGAER